MVGERLLILGQPEKVVLFANPLRRQRWVKGTLAVDEIFLLLELLTAHAVPALVDALVDVAGVVDAARDLGDADAVARLRRADEVVERDVEPLPRLAELLLHPVAIGRSEERRVGKEGT